MNEEENIFNHLDRLKKTAVSSDTFKVPPDYFKQLTPNIIAAVRELPGTYPVDSDTPPVLRTVSKSMPYTAPETYFENFTGEVLNKIGRRRLYRVMLVRKYIAAAVAIGLIVLVSLAVLFNRMEEKRSMDLSAAVMQEIRNTPTDELNSFFPGTDAGYLKSKESESAVSANNTIDFSQLFKKVSEKDLKIFLEETGNEEDDFLLN